MYTVIHTDILFKACQLYWGGRVREYERHMLFPQLDTLSFSVLVLDQCPQACNLSFPKPPKALKTENLCKFMANSFGS
jgi:hypothetical protein